MSFLEQYTSSPSPALPSSQTSSRPSTSQWYHDQILRELPFISGASRSRSGSPSRSRNNTGTQTPKRLSVLGQRSRSDTANSSNLSPASSMTSSKRSSHDGSKGVFDFVLPLEKEESSSKSFFSRGNRILRRQGKQMHRLKSKYLGSLSTFYHITPHQPWPVTTICLTLILNDLATRILPSSAPLNGQTLSLKGIHAQNLSYRPYTAEEESDWTLDILAPDAPSLFTRSPPGSPRTAMMNVTSPDSRPLRMPRSVENFSRPVSRVVRHPFSPPMVPPPRRSSKMAMSPKSGGQAIDPAEELMGLNGLSLSPVEDGSINNIVGYAVSPPAPCPVAEPIEEIGRAFSPDENNTASTKPSPLVQISGVIEDNEPQDSHVIAFDPAPYNAHMEPELVEMPSEAKKPALYLSPLKETRFEYEDMHSPILPPEQPRKLLPPVEPKSPAGAVGMHASNDSWEADIDYCYEHAAESNSNFDWNRNSSEENRDRECSNLGKCETSGGFKSNTSSFYLHPLDTTTSGQTTPELQPSSGISASTRTESDAASPAIFNHPFGTFPSSAESLDKKPRTSEIQVLETHFEDVSHDSVYTHVISDIDEDDEYHIDGPAYVRTGSSPLSKCNSQESMMLSRAASIVRKHRSSTSTNSVPDLIHSPNCSREMVDREVPTSPLAERPAMPIYSRSHPVGREAMPRMPFASFSGVEPTSNPSPAMHDRSKSASVLESTECHSSELHQSNERPHSDSR
ncbi:hypothetical protein MGYG_03853, partial [Nannizzia gypsea CBS 118893]